MIQAKISRANGRDTLRVHVIWESLPLVEHTALQARPNRASLVLDPSWPHGNGDGVAKEQGFKFNSAINIIKNFTAI